jgi:uncharacterized protein (TIGR01777 family)
MKVYLAGATGFVGQPLVEALLDRGDQVTVASRSAKTVQDAFGSRVSVAGYDDPIDGYGAVVNLAGAGIADKRWTPERKKLIRDSRVDTTTAIATAIAAAESKPGVLVNASAIGYYGARPDSESLDETAKPGTGYLPTVCQEWEQATSPASDAGVRTVLLRVGVVLGRGGGALAKMVTPFKFFVGGKLGHGRQQMSWIHRRDVVALILHCIDNKGLSGPVNCTAPEPVSNGEFSKQLARTLGRPCLFPVPGFALKLAVGEFADALLTGQRVLPKAALDSGFEFSFPQLDGALQDILAAK